MTLYPTRWWLRDVDADTLAEIHNALRAWVDDLTERAS